MTAWYRTRAARRNTGGCIPRVPGGLQVAPKETESGYREYQGQLPKLYTGGLVPTSWHG